LASAFSQLGRIDVVVSNAGYGLFGAAEEVTDVQIDHQIATNLIGSIQFIRAAIPHLWQQGGGRIVQVSSEGGQIAYPAFSLCHATADGARPALRLALGSTAYDSISHALAKGLVAIEAQRNVAFSADRDSD
jgi:NAD(P)-dependent dehydrogenase (short-subunit alcohol dehydrogenase family)